MKIRILDNTLRIRVSMDEMQELFEGKELRSEVAFPLNSLTIITKATSHINSVSMENYCLSITLDRSEIRNLHQSSEVGFSFQSDEIDVLFEKDFKCLTARKEDESKLYINPQTSH